eukprot:g2636.t1
MMTTAAPLIAATTVCIYLYNRLQSTRADLEAMTKLRWAERSGRTALEQRVRNQVKVEQEKKGYNMRPVGILSSCFPDRRGTPRQPILCPSTRAKVVLGKHLSPSFLDGLSNFSHVWLLFVFHENTNAKKINPDDRTVMLPGKIRPPQLGGKRTGIFSTRTPHRPNPIGLSTARVELVDENKRTLYLSGIDLVDGTPILDIKPYIPMDCLSEYPDGYEVPQWIKDNQQYLRQPVAFSTDAEANLKQVVSETKRGRRLKFYSKLSWPLMKTDSDSYDALREAIVQVLSLDIRAVHQGRGNASSEQYNMRFDNLQIFFITKSDGVFVNKVERYRKK